MKDKVNVNQHSPPQVRINNPDHIPYSQIEHDLTAGKHVIIQFSERHYTDSLLSDINDLCTQYPNNFGVRFYGHYESVFDCETLLKIPHVKCLYMDCLRKAVNINILKELINLKKLSIGIYELDETEILNFSNLKNLEDLIVIETKTTALNLKYLKDYSNLKFLIVGGHTKNIDAIGELPHLEFLSLNSVRKASVSFVNKLHKLKTLHFHLGARDDINEIGENQIEHLQITRVRGFHDMGKIVRFSNLKTLLIEDQVQLKKITFDPEMPYLEELEIINCKTLQTLKGLTNLPTLHQMRISQTAIEFSDLVAEKFPTSLKKLFFYTGKSKIDAQIKINIEELGY